MQWSSIPRLFAPALAAIGHLAFAGVAFAQVPTEQIEPPSAYVLGPDDVIIVTAVDVDAIADEPIRIDASGHIRLPMVGRLQAAGSTIEMLEQTISEALKVYLHHPEVSVNVVEYHSRPVSVLGAVKSPGVQQLAGTKTLAEVLAAAGGLEPDAGSIVITRRKEWGPLPLANTREVGEFSVAHVDLAVLLQARQPGTNIPVAPHDVITVPRANLVYVLGEVRKAGPLPIRDGESVSVLKALSIAEGALGTASLQQARILRRRIDGSLSDEIPVKLKSIIDGNAPDVLLVANDILFIPNSKMKAGTVRAVESIIQLGTGLLIWR